MMRPTLLFLFILVGSVYASNLWAQHPFTTDGRHFTVPAQPATESNASQVTLVTNPIPAEAKRPVVLNFDKQPTTPWTPYSCSPGVTTTTSHGILTIDSPASNCYEYDLRYPLGIWHHYVSNTRGWVVEASLQVDPSTMNIPFFDGAVLIWIHDHTNLLIVGFNTDQIFLTYPEPVAFPMDTTDSFHIYRIESKGKRVRIFVDGHLAIDHVLTLTGGGSNDLMFGDGNDYTGKSSLTRWDYFSYEVFPDPPLSE